MTLILANIFPFYTEFFILKLLVGVYIVHIKNRSLDFVYVNMKLKFHECNIFYFIKPALKKKCFFFKEFG